MSKKISQLEELLVDALPDDGGVFTVVVSGGINYKFDLANVAAFVPLPTREDLGLGNIDNTSDADKPVSIAVARALMGKAAVVHRHEIENVIGLTEALDSKAPIQHTHNVSEITGYEQPTTRFKKDEW